MNVVVRTLASVWVGVVSVATADAAERYSGRAFDLANASLLYREVHYLYAQGDRRERLVLYECADGGVFARKAVHDSNAAAPDFDMHDARTGYHEGMRRAGDKVDVYVRRGNDAVEQVKSLALSEDDVADAGFDVFVHAHWDALIAGDTLRFPFLVPSKQTFYEFKVARVAGTPAGAGTVTLRLSLGAWFSFLLPHIDVGYSIDARRIVRYEGISNIRDTSGANLQVRLEYADSDRADNIAQDEVDAAANSALVATCQAAQASK